MTKITGRQMHGEAATPKLLAGILPARGIHVLTGVDARINSAIYADLSVALATGPVGGGPVGPARRGGLNSP